MRADNDLHRAAELANRNEERLEMYRRLHGNCVPDADIQDQAFFTDRRKPDNQPIRDVIIAGNQLWAMLDAFTDPSNNGNYPAADVQRALDTWESALNRLRNGCA